MLENTSKNKLILTVFIAAGVGLLAGTLSGKENRPFLWAGGAVVGLMASQAFVPIFLKPTEVVLTERKDT